MPMHIERVKGEFRVNIMCILGASGDKSLSDEISLEDTLLSATTSPESFSFGKYE